MHGSITNYLNGIKRAWDAGDADIVATFLSLRDRHVFNQNLYIATPEKIVERIIDSPLDEVVSAHLRTVFQLVKEPAEYMEAFQHQSQCCNAVVRLLQQLKDENWCLPIMYSVCLDLRYLAQTCEKHCKGFDPGHILEKAADCLMSCFRVCAADGRAADEDSKRVGILNVTNQLIKIYFQINKYHLCKPLVRAFENCNIKDTFPVSEQITYKYFVGRRAMFESEYKRAEEYLTFAFTHCPEKYAHNKRLILIYLIPVKMLLGYMPRKTLLEQHDLLLFHELTEALKQGNVRRFDEVVREHEVFLISSGIYLLVENLKFNVYRNLFKKVYLLKQTHQLDLNDFCEALKFVGAETSLEETHCIVANLIFVNKIKGYISQNHNKVVVSKQNPFPVLTSIT